MRLRAGGGRRDHTGAGQTGVTRARLLAASLPLLAAGCGTGADGPGLACPRPAIIEELASLDRVRDGGDPSRVEDLTYSAALQNIGGTCTTDGADLVVNLTIETAVKPGPAFPDGQVELPYFVAVVAPDGTVLEREDFVAAVPMTSAGGATRESVSQRFLGLGDGAPGYRILFGFAGPGSSPSPGPTPGVVPAPGG